MTESDEFAELLLGLSERDHVLFMLLSACEKDVARIKLYENLITRLTTKDTHDLVEDISDVAVKHVEIQHVKPVRKPEKFTETERQLDAELGRWGGSSSLPSDDENEESLANAD